MKMCVKFGCVDEGVRVLGLPSEIGRINVWLCLHHFEEYYKVLEQK